MEQSKRNDYIDVLKGIGIISVVYYHCNLWGGYIVSCFMLALFFFVSGYLYKERSFREFIVKKIKSLYLPFVVIELFYLIIRNFLFSINVYNQNSGMMPLSSAEDVIANLFHIFLFDTVDRLIAPLWFLAALFGSNLLFFFIHKLIKNNYVLLILAGGIFFVIGNALTAFGFAIKASYYCGQMINVCFVATLFTIVGYVCRQKGVYRYLQKLPKYPIIESGLLGILIFFCYVLKLRIDMMINYYSSAFGFLVCSILGIMLVSMCAYRIQKIKIIKEVLIKFGKYSFEIMAFHFSAFKIVSVILIMVLGLDFSLLGYRLIPDLSKWIMTIYFIFGGAISLGISIVVKYIKNSVKFLVCSK